MLIMAINLSALQVSKPKANITDYFFTIYGKPKAGKTSLYAKLMSKLFGNVNTGLLIAFEKGYSALEVVAQDINEWEDFQDVVDQLVEERDNLPFKSVCIDTADVMYTMACEYIVKRKKLEDKKMYKVIGDIPFGGGYQLVDLEMTKQIQRIMKAGYGMFVLSHDVDKKFESRDGVSYDKTTISLPTRARNTILNASDFILYVDIAKEKEGDQLVDKRYIWFRADGSDLEAGSRFENVPDKIEYDIDLFIETFEDAVLGSFKNDDKAVNKAKKEQAKQKEEEAKKFVEAEKSVSSSADIIAEIDKIVKGMDKTAQAELKAKLKDQFGSFTYKKYDEAKLPEALELAKSLV